MDKDKIFDQLFEVVKKRLSNASGCHDFDHTLRVMANAEKLCQQTDRADTEIVRFAALLHDIARPEEIAARGKCCHAAAGAEMAEEILRQYDMPEEFIQAVSDAVRTHRYRSGGKGPQSIEAMIVYDADKLDSLGAVGIGRAFLFAGREGARLHNRTNEALSGEAYGREDTAYREYLVKLRHLPAAMLTDTGREMATARLSFMKGFFEQLDREVFGGNGENNADSDIQQR